MNDILKKIIQFADEHEDIRACLLTGSRTNSNITPDIYQDYDVIMLTNTPDYYLHDHRWVHTFGDLVMYQHNIIDLNKHIFLLLYQEQFRIDMTFVSISRLSEVIQDSLLVKLLDKDGMIPNLGVATEKNYYVKKPTEQEFQKAVNEFFWCLNNVAKGIKRDELIYVKTMFDTIVRKPLIEVICWYIGCLYDFQVNLGAYGRFIKRYLPFSLYELLEETYVGKNYEDIWGAILTSCRLMRITGTFVAEKLGYQYPLQDDINMQKYLEKIKNTH
ncbi:MAG: aminoglycoside 6-adenylyltransferase [Bacilli bacterium]|nr:aminoglycoside 6-adenylyltransferase [Bacilli bacterium]